jgi:hypothetical protein
MNTRETVIERERRIMQAIIDRQHGIDTPDVTFNSRAIDPRQSDSSARDAKQKKNA